MARQNSGYQKEMTANFGFKNFVNDMTLLFIINKITERGLFIKNDKKYLGKAF